MEPYDQGLILIHMSLKEWSKIFGGFTTLATKGDIVNPTSAMQPVFAGNLLLQVGFPVGVRGKRTSDESLQK